MYIEQKNTPADIEAKEKIEAFKDLQRKGRFRCPRCGKDDMSVITEHNALSRRADIYICEACGMDEALRDAAGLYPLPFTEWAFAKEQ